MAGPLFVGHPRPVWKVVLLQLVTLGIYGRVWLYRSVREIDGHKVWFLDLNLYLVGVVLPIGGPLAVKWKLVGHMRNMLAEEVAMRRVRATALRWAALLPWIPLYHGFVQAHLNRYWVFNRKLADIDARREVLEQQRAAARTPAQREKLKPFEQELEERAAAIEAARGAAIALRDAQLAREATLESARSKRRRPSILSRFSPKDLLGKVFKRRPEGEEGPAAEPAKARGRAPEAEGEAPRTGRFSMLTRRLPFGRQAGEPEEAPAEAEAETAKKGKKRKQEPAPEPEPVREEPPAPKKGKGKKAPEPDATPADEAEGGEKESFFAKRKRLAAEKKAEKEAKKAAEAPAEDATPEKPAKLSRKERKTLKILEKERQRREKERAKEEAEQAKLQKKLDKKLAKQEAKEAATSQEEPAVAKPRAPKKAKK